MKRPAHLVNIIIRRSLLFPYKRPWLKSIVTGVLSAEDVVEPMEINCVITDDKNICEFNRRYRGMDKATDVLSFALSENPAGGARVDFPAVPGTSGRFGDIMISYPRATAQAAELGHGVKEEMEVLLVHGTLHLLGYDHKTTNEAKKMASKEKAIIRAIHERAEEK